jgi:hypothetical protein
LPVEFHAVFRGGAEHGLGVFVARARDVGRDHLDLQARLVRGLNRAREILRHAIRQHVALRDAHRVIYSAVAGLRDDLRGVGVGEHVQGLRENVDRARGHGRRVGGGGGRFCFFLGLLGGARGELS